MKNISVLVLSCDRYRDLWNGFFECYEKHAKAMDVQLYLGSNICAYSRNNLINIQSIDDKDWSTTTIKLISQIESKFIIVLLEDIYITSKIDENYFKNIVNFVNEHNVNYLRLFNRPGENFNKNNQNLAFELEKFHPYRLNVVGLWNKEFLMKMLIPGESPWNFEIMGSYRSSYYERVYSLDKPLFKYKNMVEKGRWIPSSVRWAKRNNVTVNLSSREMPTLISESLYYLKLYYFELITKLHPKKRIKAMEILRKVFASY